MHEIVYAIGQLTDRLDRVVISGVVRLIRRLRAAATGARPIPGDRFGPEAVSDAMRVAEDHLQDLITLSTVCFWRHFGLVATFSLEIPSRFKRSLRIFLGVSRISQYSVMYCIEFLNIAHYILNTLH